MRVRLIAVGSRMPQWVEQGYQEYVKRLPPDFRLEIVEIAAPQRSKGQDIRKIKEREAKQILALLPKDELVVALDEGGDIWSTQALANNIADWRMQGRNLSFLVGGPDGLTEECLTRAQSRWSLSRLTFPHPLVRVVLAEQLYRAMTILNNHPYHR